MTYQALFAAAFALSGAGVMAGESPYQADGIAMTPYQQSVLISSNAQKRLSALASVDGSQRQIMVLTQRAPPNEGLLRHDLLIKILR